MNDIRIQSENVEDMNSELPTELYKSCIQIRLRIAKIVEAKSMYETDIERIPVYLQLVDKIDSCTD